MSVLKYELKGNRGRSIKIYDRKVEITVRVTAGSVLTGNATDGEKTIYYTDVIGLQHKRPGTTIGYLQFETASGQMNNEKSGFWSENTFTYTHKDVAPGLMSEVINYIKDTLEVLKFGSISSIHGEETRNVVENIVLDDLPEL